MDNIPSGNDREIGADRSGFGSTRIRCSDDLTSDGDGLRPLPAHAYDRVARSGQIIYQIWEKGPRVLSVSKILFLADKKRVNLTVSPRSFKENLLHKFTLHWISAISLVNLIMLELEWA